MARLTLRGLVLGYLAAIVIVPMGMIVYRAFGSGLGAVATALTSPQAVHAVFLSVLIAAIAVPLSVVFGVGTGLLLARDRMPARRLVDLVIDLPFAMSPVVIGLALFVLYGRTGWLGPWANAHGIQVLFSVPGMVLATAVVCLPFVVREVVPVLTERGTDQQQAAEMLGASPWQTFWRITLPSIRWAIVYGVVLSTARALGEYGAVSIVSGNIVGQTQTLPIYVEERFRNFDAPAAYGAALLLALLSLLVLGAMTALGNRRIRSTT